MSGGPPHSHGRQAPSPNTAWNHLQVPNYYPRQPQHAHMSSEHPIIHQPTWHTPTTEPVKSTSHSHIYNLEQAISERPYARHSPGVDLTLQRNGGQNGELAPISLSVRDTNKINSLPVSAMHAVELTKSVSPKPVGLVVKPVTSLCKIPNSNNSIPQNSTPSVIEKLDNVKNVKRFPKSMDSIIERLNPVFENKSIETSVIISERTGNTLPFDKNSHTKVESKDKPQSSVIVQPTSTTTNIHDESSSSSSILNVPTPTNIIDEDVVSPFSNEDSTDSNKSRRKRKPFKTVRLSKDTEISAEHSTDNSYLEDSLINNNLNKCVDSLLEQRRSESAPPGNISSVPLRARRKTSSESETIANIAAMIERTTASKPSSTDLKPDFEDDSKPISVSVIKSKDNVLEILSCNDSPTLSIPAEKKLTETKTFVEVENQLEEMFAGISDDTIKPLEEQNISLHFNVSKNLGLDETAKSEDNILKLDDEEMTTNHLQESVTSTSNDFNSSSAQRRTRKKGSKFRYSTESYSEESSPKRIKVGGKKLKTIEDGLEKTTSKKNKNKTLKCDVIKDINAYDSGSNASSVKSRGPFVHICGPRESPLSVQVINTSINEDDSEKKSHKSKKYHDDGEYRHKVRSRGLHSSTLSNKYDAQTRDTTWICVFCKLGPHASYSQQSVTASPGDLFGPYLITCTSQEYSRHLDDPYDNQFKSKKVARVAVDKTLSKPSMKKSKRNHSDSVDSHSSIEKTDSDVYLGMFETGDRTYEVWAHEDCIVWSSGIYLVGPKIIGLEEAVWSTCNVRCSKCQRNGANVCCVKRGCLNAMHYGCAVGSDWLLDVQSYKVLCSLHKTS